MITTTQSRPMSAALSEGGVAAFGVSDSKGAYALCNGNLSPGRDGWYGPTDVYRIRDAPTLVA